MKNVKSVTLEIDNIYGIPFYTPEVAKYAAAIDAHVIFGVTSLKDGEIVRAGKKFLLVIANLAFLASSRIPVVGYITLPTGMYVKSNFPRRLSENKIKVYIPNYKFPSSDQLEVFYKTGDVSTIENKRFTRYLSLTTAELTARVFGKDPYVPDDTDSQCG